MVSSSIAEKNRQDLCNLPPPLLQSLKKSHKAVLLLWKGFFRGAVFGLIASNAGRRSTLHKSRVSFLSSRQNLSFSPKFHEFKL